MISNVSFSSENVLEESEVLIREIEEEEENHLFIVAETEYQDILISDGGSDVFIAIEPINSPYFIFSGSLEENSFSITFLNESFHTPLYIQFCSLRAHIS